MDSHTSYVHICVCCLHVTKSKQISKIVIDLLPETKRGFESLFEERVAPNTNEQRLQSGLCKIVIRHEATETEGFVLFIYERYDLGTDHCRCTELLATNNHSVRTN